MDVVRSLWSSEISILGDMVEFACSRATFKACQTPTEITKDLAGLESRFRPRKFGHGTENSDLR